MSNTVKVALYITLILIASVAGFFSLKGFGRVMNKQRLDTSELEQVEPEKKEPVASVEPETGTNTLAATTASNAIPSVVQTNMAALSNALSVLTNQDGSTNAIVAPHGTNGASMATASTNVGKKNSKVAKANGARGGSVPAEQGGSHMVLWTALFVVSLAGLGLLIARDVSHYFGNKALEVIYNDEGKGVANPEYETAEQVWANGKHLEAIGLMREYLNKNPREQHVALRIAEIYEKDLQNHLAAALEYEEVLKHKLAPDRWGWAAIHLCNLYFKLDQEQKAYALLRRIVKEYGETPAAEKARKRLEQVDGSMPLEDMTEGQVNSSPGATSPTEAAPPSNSNLPPGFRPKK
jgi:TolA-binding protein